MIQGLHRKNRQVFAAVIALLSVAISLASMYIYDQQKQQLHNSLSRKVVTELDLIGSVLTDAMLRHDYSEGRRLLADWPINHPDVVELTVLMDNGVTFFAYRNDQVDKASPSLTRDFRYAERTLSITLCHDATEVSTTLAQLSRNLLIASLAVMVLIGAALWFILFRWMIKPMEQEISRQTHELRKSHDHLEEQVLERTASLANEVEIRKRAEQSLRKLVRVVDQSPIMVFITDTEGIIEYVNPKFEQITGYSREEAIGANPSILKSPDTPREVHEDLWNTVLAGKEWRHEIKDLCKDGSDFWASVHITPIRDKNGDISHFASLHEDITERKQAELEIENARRAAELSDKAKTELLANMSHELRTPLNAIIGFAETMRHKVFGPLANPKYEEYADFIHSSGSHLLELINDILDVSAIEAGKLTLREETVDVTEICAATLEIIRPRAHEMHIELTGIDIPDLPLLRADPLRLKQIFINLLCNAVKFTPENGAVSCNAVLDQQGNMILSVMDNGIGMTSEELVKALDTFGQVDSSLSRKHEGTGLGLPLTKGLVELHGGEMEIASAPGKGTTVLLHFPSDRVLEVDSPQNQAV